MTTRTVSTTLRPIVNGVIFDMDGTLTMPGAINFKAMYERIGLTGHGDILSQIENFSEVDKVAAHRIIVEEEMAGCRKMELRGDLLNCLQALQSRGVKLAVSTRNCAEAYDHFMRQAALPVTTFNPALSRDSLGGINKPDPQVAHYILNAWSMHENPEHVWFVGDSEDDMTCGRDAGCMTCLVRTPQNLLFRNKNTESIDLHVDSLTNFVEHIFPSR